MIDQLIILIFMLYSATVLKIWIGLFEEITLPLKLLL